MSASVAALRCSGAGNGPLHMARLAPASPAVSLDDGTSVPQPTKLFIGGISRHTTTKQIKDHFSKTCHVLDCVAMRHQDGRSRGFGYVTVDSLATAHLCLAESHVIDARVVDLKIAVPESTLIEEVHPEGDVGKPKCQVSLPCSPHRPALASPFATLAQVKTVAEQQLFNLQRLSASDRLRLFDQLAQTFPSMSDDELLALAAGCGPSMQVDWQSVAHDIDADDSTKEIISAARDCIPPPPQVPPPAPPSHLGKTSRVDWSSAAATSDEDASTDANSWTSSPTTLLRFPEDSDDEQRDVADLVVGEASEVDFPSMGSVGHFLGQCRRCNFYAKGRCGNGKNCTFCHLPHEQKNKSRQEKRARKTAWLEQRGHQASDDLREDCASPIAAKPTPLQTIALSELLSESLPLSLAPQDFPQLSTSPVCLEEAPASTMQGFEFTANFVNFADYSDDDSEEEEEAEVQCTANLPREEEASDVAESSILTDEVDRADRQWSREDLLCLRTAMKASDAFDSSAMRCPWRTESIQGQPSE